MEKRTALVEYLNQILSDLKSGVAYFRPSYKAIAQMFGYNQVQVSQYMAEIFSEEDMYLWKRSSEKWGVRNAILDYYENELDLLRKGIVFRYYSSDEILSFYGEFSLESEAKGCLFRFDDRYLADIFNISLDLLRTNRREIAQNDFDAYGELKRESAKYILRFIEDNLAERNPDKPTILTDDQLMALFELNENRFQQILSRLPFEKRELRKRLLGAFVTDPSDLTKAILTYAWDQAELYLHHKIKRLPTHTEIAEYCGAAVSRESIRQKLNQYLPRRISKLWHKSSQQTTEKRIRSFIRNRANAFVGGKISILPNSDEIRSRCRAHQFPAYKMRQILAEYASEDVIATWDKGETAKRKIANRGKGAAQKVVAYAREAIEAVRTGERDTIPNISRIGEEFGRAPITISRILSQHLEPEEKIFWSVNYKSALRDLLASREQQSK